MNKIFQKEGKLIIKWQTPRYRLYSLIAFVISVLLLFLTQIEDADADAIIFVAVVTFIISVLLLLFSYSTETIFDTNGSVFFRKKRFIFTKKASFELNVINSIEFEADGSTETVDVTKRTYKFNIFLKFKDGEKIKIGTTVLPINMFSSSGVFPPDRLDDLSLRSIFDFTGLPLEISLVYGLFTPIPKNITELVVGVHSHEGGLGYDYISNDEIHIKSRNVYKYSSTLVVTTLVSILLLSIVFGIIVYIAVFYFLENPNYLVWLIYFVSNVTLIFTYISKYFPAFNTEIIVDKSRDLLEKLDMDKKKVLFSIPLSKIVSINVWRNWEENTGVTHIYTIEEDNGRESLLAYAQAKEREILDVLSVSSTSNDINLDSVDGAILQTSILFNIPLKIKN